MSKVVIEVNNLGKQYRLGQVGTTTMVDDFKRWTHKIQGKEDPFLKIGEENDRSKKGNSDYVWALKDINFSVKQGEVLGIIGKNGAGKSTLLKILSRTTSPTIGEYKIKGRVASLLEVGTGFHPDLTGRENVFLNGAILGMTKIEIMKSFDEIVNFSGVERYIDTPVKRYSSGMYVRLAFAVAAHLNPEILIVDEVLAVGDAEFQKKCLGKMKDVSGEGRTVLFVSHNMTAVTSLCTNCVYLKNGTVSKIGHPEEIIKEYLSDGTKASTSRIWDRENAPGNDIVKLYEIDMISEDGKNLDFVNINQSFAIKFSYELFNDIVDPLPQIHVFTQKEENAFISYGNMNLKTDIKPDKIKTGKYTSTVWFPPNLFNADIYTVAIGFVDYSKIKLHFYVENAISFEVIENLNERKINYTGVIGGVLRPLLKWETHNF